jgi:hypothetical protein
LHYERTVRCGNDAGRTGAVDSRGKCDATRGKARSGTAETIFARMRAGRNEGTFVQTATVLCKRYILIARWKKDTIIIPIVPCCCKPQTVSKGASNLEACQLVKATRAGGRGGYRDVKLRPDFPVVPMATFIPLHPANTCVP